MVFLDIKERMASNTVSTTVEPDQSDMSNPAGFAIMVDIICMPEGHEILENTEDNDTSSNQSQAPQSFEQDSLIFSSLSSFLQLLDNFSENIQQTQLDRAIQESIQMYEYSERKPEIILELRTRFSTPKDKESKCAICLETFNEGETVGSPECGHDFHYQCLIEWGHYKAECPVCKSSVLIKNVDTPPGQFT